MAGTSKRGVRRRVGSAAFIVGTLLAVISLGGRAAGADGRGGRARATPHSKGAVVVRTVGVGRDPVALAVDERAGRVFVVGAAGEVSMLDAATSGAGQGTPPAAWVSMLNARSGQVVGGDSIPNAPNGGASPIGIAVDARTGRFYVVATPYDTARMQPSHTTLGVLDARSGHFLRRLTLSHATVPSDSFGCRWSWMNGQDGSSSPTGGIMIIR